MSIYELNRFHKYIYSPLYNEDEKLKKFTTAILPFIKQNTFETANEKELWKTVFGNTRFNKAKFVRLLSDTVKKIEHFLVIDRFQQQREVQNVYQLEIMNERKLDKHIPEFLRLANQKQNLLPYRDANYFNTAFFFQQQKNFFLESKDQRSAEKNLEDVTESLDVYYIIQKLKYCAALLHYKNFLSLEAEMPLLQAILKHLDEKPYPIPAIQIYRHIILSQTEEQSDEHFKQLKDLFIANQKLFPVDEVKGMYVFAMNYCINQINMGRSEYLHEILSLFKYGLESELLLENGQLSQWDYKNIVTTALRVKDFKWAEIFLSEYKNKLPKTDRANAYTFNLARYYFSTKKYDQVLQLLQNVKYNDIFYQLDSKTTLLKTYYELGEWMPLYSLKDSFRVLLRRKRLITEQQKENYMNLLKLTQRLFKADVKDKAALTALQKEIFETSNVADKSWLTEKINELLPVAA